MHWILDVTPNEEFQLRSCGDGTAILTIYDEHNTYEIRIRAGEVLKYMAEWLMLSHLEQTVEKNIPF